MDKVLYYPYINLPKNRWTYGALLYWDKIGTIVPQTYGTRDRFDSFTEGLINQGLLERVDPSVIWSISNYESSLIEAINNGDQLIENSRINFQNGKFYKIHFEKFHYHVFEKLMDLKIAQQVNNSDWFIVESNVSKLIMTYLASMLSQEQGYQLITDNIDNLDVSFNDLRDERYLVNINESNDVLTANLRTNVLENLLPYPVDFDLYKIRSFKEKHHSELISFRKQMEKVIFNVSLISDSSKRDRALRQEIKEINETKNELIAKMRESNFHRIFFSGACGLLATATPMIVEPQLIGIPALLYGLYTVYKETHNEKIKNPIKYLALTEKKFNYNTNPQLTQALR
jgi:hypothetical protein